MPPSSRPRLLSSRVLCVTTLTVCAIAVALLTLAYRHHLEERQLADQIAVVREAATIARQIADRGSTSGHAPTDRQQTWLSANLHGLGSGGELRTLDNAPIRLAPIGDAEASRRLMELTVRWQHFRRITVDGARSGLADEELRQFAPALAALGTRLAERREEAARSAMLLVGLALGISLVAFITVGALLRHESRRFERSGQLLRSMLNQIGAGVCILGGGDKIVDANRAACRMLGRPRRDLRGRCLSEFLHEDGDEGVWTGDRPDGIPLAVERIPGTIEGEKGPLRIVTLLDVTARHLTAECLQHLANHDVLTGLPNRGFLESHLKRELARSEKESQVLGVAVIDLDGFKPVNDTYGHAVGDELLIQVAQRFTAALRIRDLIARTGGDEFVGIFPDVGNRDSLAFLADRLLGVFREPFQVLGHSIVLGGSIGLAISPDDGRDQDSLLHAADAAMYRAKRSGRHGVQLTAVSGTGKAA